MKKLEIKFCNRTLKTVPLAVTSYVGSDTTRWKLYRVFGFLAVMVQQ